MCNVLAETVVNTHWMLWSLSLRLHHYYFTKMLLMLLLLLLLLIN